MRIEAGPSAFSTIVNEGPVSLSALENTMTIAKFNPIGEIVFKPSVPSVIEQAEAVAAAAWEKIELTPQETVVVLPRVEPAAFPQTEPVVLPTALPQVEPAPALQTSPAPKVETRVSNRISPAVSPQPLLQAHEVKEIVTEKVTKEGTNLVEEEEIERIKRKYVVDERALSQVVVEFKEAVRKARELAGKLGIKITGHLVSKFLPGQHPGNESEAVKRKGPDGSIPERQQSIEESGEFSSVSQVEDKVVKIAYAQPPIKDSLQGEPVKYEDVARVFRPYDVKPVAHEMFIKRVVKKGVHVPAGQVPAESKIETTLEDYPELEKVFGRAA